MNPIQFDIEKINDIANVSDRLNISCSLIGKKLNAIGYKASTASSWVTFVLENKKTIFGSIHSGSGDIEIDVSDYPVFARDSMVCFSEEKGKWKQFFKIPDVIEDISDFDKIIY